VGTVNGFSFTVAITGGKDSFQGADLIGVFTMETPRSFTISLIMGFKSYFCTMDTFETFREIVINRRSVKPAVLNGKIIDNQLVMQLLELANWAPTHGITEPWRFVVFSGEAVRQFCHDHAEMYRQSTPPDKFNPSKYEKQRHNGDMASHLIAVYMKRHPDSNIPALEEICATAAAVENILLGAETLSIAVLWSTGGAVQQPAMKQYLELGEEDLMIGLLYLGYTDEPAKPGRRGPATEKIRWIGAV
jgi:nitroreductase